MWTRRGGRCCCLGWNLCPDQLCATGLAKRAAHRVEGAAACAFDLTACADWRSAQHTSAFTLQPLLQVTSTLDANLRIGAVACITKWTVNIGTLGRIRRFFFICNQNNGLFSKLKLRALGLWRPAG